MSCCCKSLLSSLVDVAAANVYAVAPCSIVELAAGPGLAGGLR